MIMSIQFYSFERSQLPMTRTTCGSASLGRYFVTEQNFPKIKTTYLPKITSALAPFLRKRRSNKQKIFHIFTFI